MNWLLLILLLKFLRGEHTTKSPVHPIEIKGNYFYDSVTNDPFFIKGLAYQPGGSSEVDDEKDPLSNPSLCARDIFNFQQLGVNTIRIYSINPDLKHDECMSMLATAGIYLILDINSPMMNQHLNRYEPWSSYNPDYLEHIFKVVKQFSSYPNTLAFFAGNEIVNDRKSANISPKYIRQILGDVKLFMKNHCERIVPIGYSAADDLDYRVPLAKYLECYEKGHSERSVDFYGVNSYQWCGRQTMETSGYNELLKAYEEYTKPLILSEYGCNKVLPRAFGEIQALYSNRMMGIFSGGLAYEYSQEENNYGLVDIHNDGSLQYLEDFETLKNQYKSVTTPKKKIFQNEIKKSREFVAPQCLDNYDNLNVKVDIKEDLSSYLIKEGVKIEEGKFTLLNDSILTSNYNIYSKTGNLLSSKSQIQLVNDLFPVTEDSKEKDKQNPKKKNNSTKKTIGITSVIFLLILNTVIL